MQYHARAVKSVREVHSSKQFDWLRVRDEAERQQWVEKHRSGTTSLGSVIKQTMLEREAMWLASAEDKATGNTCGFRCRTEWQTCFAHKDR